MAGSNCSRESSARAALTAASLIATMNSISLAYSKYVANDASFCRFLLAMDLTKCVSGTSLTFPSLVVVVHVAGVVQSIVTEAKLAAGAKTATKVDSLVQAFKVRHCKEYVDLNASMTVVQSTLFRLRFRTASLWATSAVLMPLTVLLKTPW